MGRVKPPAGESGRGCAGTPERVDAGGLDRVGESDPSESLRVRRRSLPASSGGYVVAGGDEREDLAGCVHGIFRERVEADGAAGRGRWSAAAAG